MLITPTAEAVGLTPFLNSLYPDPLDDYGDAFIETRVLSDQQKKSFGSHWYSSPDALESDYCALKTTADGQHACVAFSPAIRKTRQGTKEAVLGSWCLWNDQNQRDGGQNACIQRLLDDDLAITVVNSGFAAHGYVLLDDFCDDVGKIETGNRLLKKRLGGDAVQDAGRVMRLPGTTNYKIPGDPRMCQVVELADHRYDIDELIERLTEEEHGSHADMVTTDSEVLSQEAEWAHQYDPILQRIEPATVEMLFEQCTVGDRSEHDLALVNRLVMAGLSDDEVYGIYARYPCGEKARENGFTNYVSRTIAKARTNGHLFVVGGRPTPETPDQLQRRIGEIRATERTAPARQEATAQVVLDYFDRHGKFFSDGTSTCHLHHDGRSYLLSDNRPFRSMLQDVAGLSLENKDGKLTLDRLANHALRRGQVATTRGPIYADRKKHAIYVHPGGDAGKIIQVTPGAVDSVTNGTNEEGICLIAPPEIQPFDFQPDIDVRDALELYQSKLIDWLACDEVDRLTVSLWLPNVFLLDYSTVKIVLKASGPQSSGKTVACRLLGTLFAGDDILKLRPTPPSIYADPLPLQIWDNVENKDLRRALEDIILFAATGGTKEKMRLNTDDERVRRQINCLLLLNGIESLDRSEVLSRVYEIEFDRKHQRPGFLETEIIDELASCRDMILSGLLRLLADHVLPRLANGGIREWMTKLRSAYGNHPKSRSFEFLSRMGLIAEAFEQTRHPELSEDVVHRNAWKQIEALLNRQAVSATDADAETNTLVRLLRDLAMENKHWNSIEQGPFASRYHVDADVDGETTIITATANDLQYALSVLTRQAGLRGLEIRNARSLSARLSSERHVLEQCGITATTLGKKSNTNVYMIRIDGGT
jgi:hypothetical protein